MSGQDEYTAEPLKLRIDMSAVAQLADDLRAATEPTLDLVKREVRTYAVRVWALAYRNISGHGYTLKESQKIRKRDRETGKMKRVRRGERWFKRQRAKVGLWTGGAVLNVRTGRLRGGLIARHMGMASLVEDDVFYGHGWETGWGGTRPPRAWFMPAFEEAGGEQGFIDAVTRAVAEGVGGAMP